MFHLIKIDWKKVRLPVLTVTLLLTITACMMTCIMDSSYTLWFHLDAWEIGTEYFSLLYPLFTVIPLCWNLYYERKDNFLLYVFPRVTREKYLGAKWCVYALCAFFILFIPYMLSAVFALYVNEPVLHENKSFQHVFVQAYTQAPLLYAICLSCWKGLIGVLVMTFGFVLAMYVNNIFVILTGPFIYTVLENFILSILQLPEYRLVVSFEPTSISPGAFNVGSLLIGPFLLIVVNVGTVLIFTQNDSLQNRLR